MKKQIPLAGFGISSLNIWYLSPYSMTFNIGGEYNRQIAQLPTDDWICICDHDMLFLHPESKARMYDIARSGEYDLYGPLANRLASQEQAPFKELFSEPDIRAHIAKAKALHMTEGLAVTPAKGPIAGMCMLFAKKTWERVGGFQENSINFDRRFSDKIVKKGIMQGVYVLHLYRFGHEDPTRYVKHLILRSDGTKKSKP